MTTYNQKKEKDIKKGLELEKKVGIKLRKKYKNIRQMKDKYSHFDFIDRTKKIVFEIKSTNQTELKSYRFGLDKYSHFEAEYKPKGYKFMLVYVIKKHIVYRIIKDLKDHKVILDGRTDRGRQEIIKDYVIVYRSQFKKFKYQILKNWKLTALKEIELTECLLDF